jgi:DMSO/TMAO reductase YedYZ molybdopterin-dependent catalytic subunit
MITRRRFVIVASSAIALSQTLRWRPAALAQEIARPLARFGGLTPNDEFYVTSYARTPTVNPATYALKISGLVRNPLTLTMTEIKQMPAVSETLTLECISNPPDGDAIGNAEWVGIKLKPLLEKAGVTPKAVFAVMHAADGYATGVPTAEIMRDENFLPYQMNGVPLPPQHGFPLRIFIPGKYGMKQPKWLTEISFVDREFVGYWEQRGWSQSAWRKINSGFFAPRQPGGVLGLISPAPRVKAPVDIIGWALAGPSGVRRVEVSTDGGKVFNTAELLDNHSPYVWTVWRYHFAPERAGRYEIRVRATDGNGVAQPPADSQTGSGRSGQPSEEIIISQV